MPADRVGARYTSTRVDAQVELYRRVKGPKNVGVRLGNWLTTDQARALWQVPDPNTLKGKRDRALLGLLLGCGLRRREAAELDIAHLQRRDDHWAIVDLVGKARHVRTVPVPDWVKSAIDSWLESAGLSEGRVFRCVCRGGQDLGRWCDGARCVACREGLRQKSSH